jgi:hypothetical protein
MPAWTSPSASGGTRDISGEHQRQRQPGPLHQLQVGLGVFRSTSATLPAWTSPSASGRKRRFQEHISDNASLDLYISFRWDQGYFRSPTATTSAWTSPSASGGPMDISGVHHRQRQTGPLHQLQVGPGRFQEHISDSVSPALSISFRWD